MLQLFLIHLKKGNIMHDNIFMISDASYSEATKCAGLGVIDLHSNKKYSQSLREIKDSYSAEYNAVLLSVSIAFC